MEGCFKNTLVAIAGCVLLAGVANGEVQTGERAPDFVLPSLNDSNLRLSEYRSEVVVLNFWSANCVRCETAMALLEDLYCQHKDRGLQILSVAIEGDRESATEVLKNQMMGYPILLDQDYQVSRLYDLGRLPVTVVIDRNGYIVEVDEGFRRDGDERIEAAVAGLMQD